MYAAMLERMYRGQDLPESPNELNDVPLLDILEEKLGRELDDKEADYVSKLEKRYRRFAIEQEITTMIWCAESPMGNRQL